MSAVTTQRSTQQSDQDPDTSRDHEQWQQLWRDQHLDFHLGAVNPQLISCWPMLGLATSDAVFVPLCGKSLDMLWLAQQGHQVIGVELSPLAVRAFFRENRLQPKRSKVGPFTLWQHGRISIYCGDFFQLRAEHLALPVSSERGEQTLAAVFDRASLTALPEDLRPAYLAHLRSIIPADCPLMLFTTEDLDGDETAAIIGQSAAISSEVKAIYGKSHQIKLHHIASSQEAMPDPDTRIMGELQRVEKKVYVLTPKVWRAV